MRRRKIAKYAGLTIGCTAVCVAVIFALQTGHVFGKFVSPEPYVTGAPESASVVVTSEGGTQKGTEGSAAKPCSPEVPTAEGLKGSETNPFVLLEVVPDKAMQQWTYLSGSTESGMPEQLDPLKIGIEACEKVGKNFVSEKYIGNYNINLDYGTWFCVNQYDVYKIGSNKKADKEKLPFTELTQLYEMELSSKDMDDPEQFDKDYKENCYQDNQNGRHIKKEFFKKYSDLFEKDDNGVTIRELAKDNPLNWETYSEKHVIEEEKGETYKSGYLVAVDPGKGDLGYASEEDFKFKPIQALQAKNDYDGYMTLSKTGTDKDRWIYVKTKEELESRFPGFVEIDKYNGEINVNNTLINFLDKPELTGHYFDVSQSKQYFCESPEVSEQIYTFKYYGLKTNEILKRSLFSFRDQEEFDDFHMKVICMTPAELNKLSKKDTDDTLDMIERADMFSFQSYAAADANAIVNDTDFLCKLYHQKILGEEDYEYDRDKLTMFYESDLEWDLCSKIIQRESVNKNLPLVFNKIVGSMGEEGVNQVNDNGETHMYVTKGIENDPQTVQTDVHEDGSLNNIVKMYIISVQFDLLARRATDSMDRTFMEDIFPYIQKVPLVKAEGALEDTATSTGYYMRPLCTCSLDDYSQEMKERCYYLWNLYTFFPTDKEININGFDKETFLKDGYLESFFETNANPFRDGGSTEHQAGSDGTDDKNVTIVDGGIANANQSSMLSNKGDGGGVASNTFEAAYQIMNGQSEVVEDLAVTVLKQKKRYVKISDNAVLIDYNSLAKYKEDKTLYLKVRVSNINNEAGILKKVRLVSDSGEPIDVPIQETTDPSTVMKKEDVTNSEGSDPIHGYRVDGTITFYIPYSLYKWQSGYMSVELTTQGRIYNAKKEKFVKGKENVHEISIGERNLFNLE